MTPLQRDISREEMIASGWIDEDGNPSERFKTPEQGASTATWAATAPALDGMGGVYCENCDIAEPTSRAPPPRASRASTGTPSTPTPPRGSGACRPS
jgi:hypothetical protein